MIAIMIILIITLLSVPVGNISEFCLDWLTKRARWAHLALSVGVEFQKQLKTVKMKKTNDARGFIVLKHSWLSIPFLKG